MESRRNPESLLGKELDLEAEVAEPRVSCPRGKGATKELSIGPGVRFYSEGTPFHTLRAVCPTG